MPIQLNELLHDLEDESSRVQYIRNELHHAIECRDMTRIVRYYSMLQEMEQHVITMDAELQEYAQLN